MIVALPIPMDLLDRYNIFWINEHGPQWIRSSPTRTLADDIIMDEIAEGPGDFHIHDSRTDKMHPPRVKPKSKR